MRGFPSTVSALNPSRAGRSGEVWYRVRRALELWLYFRFHLSFRDVQDLLAERGLIVSHERIRQWCTKFGASFKAGLRRRRVRTGDKWHLDEVALKIRGKRH